MHHKHNTKHNTNKAVLIAGINRERLTKIERKQNKKTQIRNKLTYKKLTKTNNTKNN